MAWPALLWAGEVVVPMVRQKESEVNDMQDHGGDIYTNDGLFDFFCKYQSSGAGRKGYEGIAGKHFESDGLSGSLFAENCGSRRQNGSQFLLTILSVETSMNLIYTLVLAEKPKQALLCTPSFSEYEKALRTVGCKIRFHKKREEDHFTLTSRYLEELTGIWIWCFCSRTIRRDSASMRYCFGRL